MTLINYLQYETERHNWLNENWGDATEYSTRLKLVNDNELNNVSLKKNTDGH